MNSRHTDVQEKVEAGKLDKSEWPRVLPVNLEKNFHDIVCMIAYWRRP